jgi:hypothetical protein
MTNYKYPHTDATRAILEDSADFVKREGLNYLIPNWQRFADNYVDKEDLIYEWLNDLDTRKIIDKILTSLSKNEREEIEAVLSPMDKKVIEKTFEINECVWGREVEEEKNYDRNRNWYYYRMNQNVFNSEAGRFTKR